MPNVATALVQAATAAAPAIAAEVARRRAERERKRAERRAAAEAANAPPGTDLVEARAGGVPTWAKVVGGLALAGALVGGGVWAYRRFSGSGSEESTRRRRRRK